MKFVFLYFLSLCFNYPLLGQKDELTLFIEDTIVTKKKQEEAIELHVNIIKHTFNPVTLYRFNRYVPSEIIDTINSQRTSSIGLVYVIETLQGKTISSSGEMLISFLDEKDEIRYYNSVIYVDEEKLQIKMKAMNAEERHTFILSKIKLISSDSIFKTSVFPLINRYFYLKKGKYLISLLYSFNAKVSNFPSSSFLWDKYKPLDESIFKGFLKSNKVLLIVQ